MNFSERLNEDSFLLFTMKYYDNPQSNHINEYNEDMSRIKYIKRLLGRYSNKNVLKERLILNHIIILGNVLGPVPASRVLFYKLEENLHQYLKPFLMFLNYLPEFSDQIPEVVLDEVPIDLNIIKTLKEI